MCVIYICDICDVRDIYISGVKKSKNFHLSPRASASKFLLVLLPNKLSLLRKNILALSFLLVRRT